MPIVAFVIIHHLWVSQAGALHLDLSKQRSELVAGRIEAIWGSNTGCSPLKLGEPQLFTSAEVESFAAAFTQAHPAWFCSVFCTALGFEGLKSHQIRFRGRLII